MKKLRLVVLIFIAILGVVAEARAGRWLSRDPIAEGAGFVQRDPMPPANIHFDQGNEPNLYAFVGNDPIDQIDNLGLVIVGFYGADTSLKWPNAGDVELERLSETMEAYDTVLRPNNQLRSDALYSSRAVNQAFSDLASYLKAHPDDKPIKIFGWSWGGASAVELANRLKQNGQRVGLVAVIDPVTALRSGNTVVPNNVFRLWNRYQRHGVSVYPFRLPLPNHGHALKIADPSMTISDQLQLDPNGRIQGLNHVSIIWWVENEFLAQFTL